MKRMLCFFTLFLILLVGCTSAKEENWGSFTADKTYSFDSAFYALQTVEEADGTKHITVTVFSSENDEPYFLSHRPEPRIFGASAGKLTPITSGFSPATSA